MLLNLAYLGAATINKIEISSVSGVEVSRTSVLSRMTLKEGGQFSNDQLSADLKELMSSGLFEDVSCKTSTDKVGKLTLELSVIHLPEIRRVSFSGNEEFDAGDLEDKVSLKIGDRLIYKTLAADKKALIALYEDKSYFGTIIDFEVKNIKDEKRIDLVWIVKEQPRFKVGTLNFEGNSALESGLIEDLLVTKKSWLSYIFPTGFFNPMGLKEDKRKIVAEYKKIGYLDAKVVKMVTTPADNRINVTYHIKEGTQYKVSSIDFFGYKDFPLIELIGRTSDAGLTETELVANLPLKVGDVYSSTVEKQIVEGVKTVYYNGGYIDVSCYSKRIKKGDQVALQVRIKENNQSTINNIYISGNRKTKDHVIRRELSLLPGDIANMRKIESSKRRLENLNYFEKVTITPTQSPKGEEKDLRITLEEKNTGQFNIGMGFSTEDSVTASFEVSQSNFDISNWPYMTGGGQKMRARLQVGSERSEFLLSLTEPWLMNKRLSLTGSLYLRERSYDEYDQKTFGTNWSLTRKMDRKFWRQTFGYTLEQVKISDLEEPISQDFLDEEGSYTVSKVYTRFSRDTTDRFRFPTRGSKFSSKIGGQSEVIGSYTNSYDFDLSYDKYILLTKERGWVLKLGANLRQIDKVSGDDIAIFDRYFAGGPGTVRGFQFRDVGPVDEFNNPVGGQSLLSATAQIRIPIMESLHLILFSDAGNAWKDEWDYNLDQLNVSVGFGFRIILPIAPISIDYGIPVVTDQDHLEDENGRVHFNLGFSY